MDLLCRASPGLAIDDCSPDTPCKFAFVPYVSCKPEAWCDSGMIWGHSWLKRRVSSCRGAPDTGLSLAAASVCMGAAARWHSDAVIPFSFASCCHPERDRLPLQIFSYRKICFTAKRHNKRLIFALHFPVFRPWVRSPVSPISDHGGFCCSITWPVD